MTNRLLSFLSLIGSHTSGEPNHRCHQPGQLCIFGCVCWPERRSERASHTAASENTQLENCCIKAFICDISDQNPMTRIPQWIKLREKKKVQPESVPSAFQRSTSNGCTLTFWIWRFSLLFCFRIRLESPLQMGADSYRAENGQKRPHTADQVWTFIIFWCQA